MTRQALDPDLLVPTTLHDPSQTHGIVPVALIDLQRERRLGMTGIDADHRQTQGTQLVPQPGRRRTGLEAVNGGAKRDHLGGVRRDRLAAAGLSP